MELVQTHNIKGLLFSVAVRGGADLGAFLTPRAKDIFERFIPRGSGWEYRYQAGIKRCVFAGILFICRVSVFHSPYL